MRIDSGEYSPCLGDSYDNVARYGLSFQRSQNSGRFTPTAGPNYGYYTRVDGAARRGRVVKEESHLRRHLPTTIEAHDRRGRASRIDDAVARAIAAFTMNDPSASVPALVAGLEADARGDGATKDPDARFMLEIKEQQFQDAINAAMGVELTAVAQPAGLPEPTGPGAAFAPPALMAAPVPGQTFEVRARLANRGGIAVSDAAIRLEGDPGGRSSRRRDWRSDARAASAGHGAHVDDARRRRGAQHEAVLLAQGTAGEPLHAERPVAVRQAGLAAAAAARSARYVIDGVPVEIRETVKRREAKLPYGDVLREVRSVPRIAVARDAGASAIVPIGRAASKAGAAARSGSDPSAQRGDAVHRSGALQAAGRLDGRAGVAAVLVRAGGRARVVSIHRDAGRDRSRSRITIEAVATDGQAEYREGYELIDHRDLEVRYLYRAVDARRCAASNVTTVAGLKVGYVMGVGDQVPQGLQQLGAQVTLLGERELASADLVAVRHHHDRHARVCGARRSQDLQLAAARLRARPAAT